MRGEFPGMRHSSYGHKESLHVQVLAGDAARRWLTLTVTGCDHGDRGKAALIVMAGTHR